MILRQSNLNGSTDKTKGIKPAKNQVIEKAIDKFKYQSEHTLSLEVEDLRADDLLGRPIKKPHNPPELPTQVRRKEKVTPKKTIIIRKDYHKISNKFRLLNEN